MLGSFIDSIYIILRPAISCLFIKLFKLYASFMYIMGSFLYNFLLNLTSCKANSLQLLENINYDFWLVLWYWNNSETNISILLHSLVTNINSLIWIIIHNISQVLMCIYLSVNVYLVGCTNIIVSYINIRSV